MRRYQTSSTESTFAKLERIAECHGVTLITPNLAWQSWNSNPQYPAELSQSYGDWDMVKDTTPIDPSKVYVLIPYCGGSDYSGNLMEVSNHKAILDMLPSEYEDGMEYLNYSGDYSTFDIAIRIDALTDDLLEAIESLQDYPVLDDSLHSQLEMESQNEAWENDIRSEFKTALGKELYATWEASPKSDQQETETDSDYAERLAETEDYLSDECGGISDDDLGTLCWKMADLANEYWTNEEGSGSWLDVDDVISGSIGSKRRCDSDYRKEAYAEICQLIQSAMSDRKYDLGIVRYIDPNQLSLPLSA